MQQLFYLPRVDSTNLWAKEHFAEFGEFGAVFTTCQTAGRGRLGRAWNNAAGEGLYYSAVIKTPLCQPATLPLLASLVVRDALEREFGAKAAIKWPNDLLLGGKKLTGILCEGVVQNGRVAGIVCGIGVNLCQKQEYFDQNGLPHGTSLLLQGFLPGADAAPGRAVGDAGETADATGGSETANGEQAACAEQAAERLAAAISAGFASALPGFAQTGFAACAPAYRAECINLGLPVTFEGGQGIAKAVDDEGNLVVETANGQTRVFTGEVSVKGVYGAI